MICASDWSEEAKTACFGQETERRRSVDEVWEAGLVRASIQEMEFTCLNVYLYTFLLVSGVVSQVGPL